jgi:transcriptional regulator with XRE-family HTH domain
VKILKNEEAARAALFADNLRYIFRSRNLSKTKVANKLGLSTATIHSYLSGRTYPNEEQICQLADVLECSVDELFDDTYAPWKFGTGDKY